MNARKLKLLLSRPDPIAAARTTAEKREVAIAMIDGAAGAARGRYITVTPGQEGVYRTKADEATAAQSVVDAGGTPDPAEFPHLAAEVGITGDSVAEVAAVILAIRNAWMAASASIESKRLGGKAAVESAEDETAIRAAVKIAWPRPASE